MSMGQTVLLPPHVLHAELRFWHCGIISRLLAGVAIHLAHGRDLNTMACNADGQCSTRMASWVQRGSTGQRKLAHVTGWNAMQLCCESCIASETWKMLALWYPDRIVEVVLPGGPAALLGGRHSGRQVDFQLLDCAALQQPGPEHRGAQVPAVAPRDLSAEEQSVVEGSLLALEGQLPPSNALRAVTTTSMVK